MTDAVLGVDQGTTRTKAIVFDEAARPLAEAASEVALTYPRPGWVEQDPDEMLRSVLFTASEAVSRCGASVATMGFANQGETVVAWDSRTGTPIYQAINWQDRRTDVFCAELRASETGEIITARTGLPIDPYFSATKIVWLLENVAGAREMAERGHLLAGTSDAWFHWKLSGRHVTDHSTASRTMLYNPRRHDWDSDVLAALRVPRDILPSIQDSRSLFGHTVVHGLNDPLPITASMVDQQAALFGQACFSEGDIKVTYGTGAFVLLNAGHRVPVSQHGLVPTVAWSVDDEITYALDGGIYVAGAAVQWLRDGLGIIQDASETAALAASVPDSGDVYFVPALTGLAAPYWDSSARGTIVGLTRGTTRAHLARATLEGIAYRTRDVVDAMVADIGQPLTRIRVDGGASANAFLMQTLADVIEVPVQVAAVQETTALGVAMMGGWGTGLWTSKTQLSRLWRGGAEYIPHRDSRLAIRYPRWKQAIERSKGWAKPD